MAEDRLEHFRTAKKLNEKFKVELTKKQLHFRGNRGSFSLVSLDCTTPEQGKSGFTDEKLLNMNKEQMVNFWSKIDKILASKRKKIEREESRPTREKKLQAWIINYAIEQRQQSTIFQWVGVFDFRACLPNTGKDCQRHSGR
jgi:hypothetical protein